MPLSFLHLPDIKQRELLEKSESRLNLPATMLEKDIWICWMLERMFSTHIPMVFKGGTSLSKAFNLIHRFSEDIDITIDSSSFHTNLDLTQPTRSQLKKISTDLKKHLNDSITPQLSCYLERELQTTFPDKNITLSIKEAGTKLFIFYPSVLEYTMGYLKPAVLLEFGIRNNTKPAEEKLISPYLAQIYEDQFSLPQPMINTLSPLRTFWEKATLMHVECHRNRMQQTPQRLSRHWYDMYMLAHSWVGPAALQNLTVLEDVLMYQKAFFNASYSHLDECLQGKFMLVPSIANQSYLFSDFEVMQTSGMLLHNTPSFHEIIDYLKQLEATINKKIAISERL